MDRVTVKSKLMWVAAPAFPAPVWRKSRPLGGRGASMLVQPRQTKIGFYRLGQGTSVARTAVPDVRASWCAPALESARYFAERDIFVGVILMDSQKWRVHQTASRYFARCWLSRRSIC